MVGILAPLSPYEIFVIFPVNDRIAEMGEQLQVDGGRGDDEKAKKELKSLLARWQTRHLVRVGIPLLTGLVGFSSLVMGV